MRRFTEVSGYEMKVRVWGLWWLWCALVAG
jgi:hypothetical protein